MNELLTALDGRAIIRLKAVEYALTLLSRQTSHTSTQVVLDTAKVFEDYMMGETGSEAKTSSVKPSADPGATGRHGSA